MDRNIAPNSNAQPNGGRGFDRSSAIFFAFFLIVMAGILFFVLSIGPTYEKLVCSRSTGQCEITETYFFGLKAPRKIVFPQDTILNARIKKNSLPIGGRRSSAVVLELVFKDGSSYPTIDYGFRPWTQRKVDEVNHYLQDSSIPGITLDSLAPSIVTILLMGILPLLLVVIVGFLAAKKRASSSK